MMELNNHLAKIDVSALIADIEGAQATRTEAQDIRDQSVKPKLKEYQDQMKEVWQDHAVESKAARRHTLQILAMEPDELGRYARVMVPIFDHLKGTAMADAVRDLVDMMEEEPA